jgi:hypothetical protein
MMALGGVAAHGVGAVSFDATSPIKDAAAGTLYASSPAYLKLDSVAVAQRIASGLGRWDCPCAFCRTLSKSEPMDYGAAVAWAKRAKRKVRYEDLRGGGELALALPLLSESDDHAKRRRIALARIGHNHWILSEVIAGLNSCGSAADALKHAQRIVAAYEKTAVPQFARGVRWALQIVSAAGACP